VLLSSAIITLGLGGIAVLFITTKVAVVGPCTEGLGAFSLLTMMICFPVGLVLLAVWMFRAIWQRMKHPATMTIIHVDDAK
jgi:hypothetical protein